MSNIVQLNPTFPLTTPLGKALCHFMIDNGDEHHLLWVCIQDDTGEIWVWPNTQVRGRNNPTMGRKIDEAADHIETLESVMKDDAKWLAAYHKWCEMNGCAPSSSDLIAARKALEEKDG